MSMSMSNLFRIAGVERRNFRLNFRLIANGLAARGFTKVYTGIDYWEFVNMDDSNDVVFVTYTPGEMEYTFHRTGLDRTRLLAAGIRTHHALREHVLRQL